MNELILYAKSFIGTPYIWSDFDCSAYAQEILASVGMDPPGDQTAQGLFDHFSIKGMPSIGAPGALVFYGKSIKHITHVSLMINTWQVIEAGGGGRECVTPEIARKKMAMVRIRPLRHRFDQIAIFMPDYPAWLRA